MKPTWKDIACQTMSEVAFKVASGGAAYVAGLAGWHFIPTYSRWFRKDECSDLEDLLKAVTKNKKVAYIYEWAEQNVKNVGDVAGTGIGVCGFAGILSILGYFPLVTNYGPKVLAIPIMTNIASGIYEVVKDVKRRMINDSYQTSGEQR